MGQSIAAMDAGFAASAEYQALYAGMTNSQVVEQVYQNLLGRASDPAGKAYWVNALDSGAQTVGSLVAAMQANALGTDVATIANRVTYAINFTVDLTPSENLHYSGSAAAVAARAAVSAVNSTDASLHTALSNVYSDIADVDMGMTPAAVAAAAAAAAATAAANNLSLYGSINGVTQTSATQALTLVAGANTVAMVGGSAAVVDTVTVDAGTTSMIANISGTATGSREIAWAGTPTAFASATVNDSSAGALNIDAATAPMTSLTLNNTGAATLTLANLTDSQALVLNIQGSGTVTESALTLTGTSLTVNDTSSVVLANCLN